ncbi:hypothetical protein [Paenibacillus sp. 32O-W]|uniref:hypothetical protein n=1 Tax=Paenibacillus sp. 32O-W TaxID=1695218 RepID=UPI001C92F8CF|nr:hypothetical protein [Paenibacillus sp. 32O-W]
MKPVERPLEQGKRCIFAGFVAEMEHIDLKGCTIAGFLQVAPAQKKSHIELIDVTSERFNSL